MFLRLIFLYISISIIMFSINRIVYILKPTTDEEKEKAMKNLRDIEDDMKSENLETGCMLEMAMDSVMEDKKSLCTILFVFYCVPIVRWSMFISDIKRLLKRNGVE